MRVWYCEASRSINAPLLSATSRSTVHLNPPATGRVLFETALTHTSLFPVICYINAYWTAEGRQQLLHEPSVLVAKDVWRVQMELAFIKVEEVTNPDGNIFRVGGRMIGRDLEFETPVNNFIGPILWVSIVDATTNQILLTESHWGNLDKSTLADIRDGKENEALLSSLRESGARNRQMFSNDLIVHVDDKPIEPADGKIPMYNPRAKRIELVRPPR